MLAMIMLLLLVAGMLLDAVSIFLIFLPILVPVVNAFGWDMTWFAVLMTMNMAIGQFTPPMAVNLLVTHPHCRDRHGGNGAMGALARAVDARRPRACGSIPSARALVAGRARLLTNGSSHKDEGDTMKRRI